MGTEFWEAAEQLMGAGRIEESTMMGGPCVRAEGEFVAMPYHKGPGLVVKLPRARVSELIAAGTGAAFAPAGKVFAEWVLIADHEPAVWAGLLDESVDFVS